jgi:hypothetical protein
VNSDIRQRAIELIGEIWTKSPDVRLGQLLAHLGFLGEVHGGRPLSEIDDDELMAVMERHKTELELRSGGQPDQRRSMPKPIIAPVASIESPTTTA